MSLLVNKKARHDYTILDQIQAGIVLTGSEVKSLRLGRGTLAGSFVQIIDQQAVLLGAQINPYPYADNRDYDPKRTRRLLLRKSEIYHLAEKVKQKRYTLIPLSFDLVGKNIKLTIGLGRGKKQYEKKALLRERDLQRERAREFNF